jgi:hypothetical protein
MSFASSPPRRSLQARHEHELRDDRLHLRRDLLHPHPRWRADRGHNGGRAGSAMDSPLPGCPMPTPRPSGDDTALGAGLAGAAGAGCAPTRPTAMVVIDGRPPPGRMLEPYIMSVPGVQLMRNSSVMQTRVQEPGAVTNPSFCRTETISYLGCFWPIPSETHSFFISIIKSAFATAVFWPCASIPSSTYRSCEKKLIVVARLLLVRPRRIKLGRLYENREERLAFGRQSGRGRIVIKRSQSNCMKELRRSGGFLRRRRLQIHHPSAPAHSEDSVWRGSVRGFWSR